MNILEDLPVTRPPVGRPLLGHTLLLVEDSRFACEAVRLMCLKSGARIRRADSLFHARQHLRVYRPSVVIIDLGLPDGSGEELIAELSRASARVDVLLATSGDPEGETRALAAGADGFLAKPISHLAEFQMAILEHLPRDRRPRGLHLVTDEEVSPDPVALRDDLALAAEALTDLQSDKQIDYVTQFLAGIALSTGDVALGTAVKELSRARSDETAARRLAAMIEQRLNNAPPI